MGVEKLRFPIAILISLAVHLLVGLGIWAFVEYAPSPEVLATLDLSSVELSFAEEEDETAAVLPQPSNPVSPHPGPERPPEPKVVETPEPLPSIPDAVDIPKLVEKPVLPQLPPNISTPQPSTPQPRQARVDAPPRPKRAIRPDYPKGSRQRGEQGDVVIEMTVNPQGEVDKAAVVTTSGFPELDEAALRAVRSARFSPARSGSEPVSSTARLTLTFRLK